MTSLPDGLCEQKKKKKKKTEVCRFLQYLLNCYKALENQVITGSGLTLPLGGHTDTFLDIYRSKVTT